MKLQKQDNKKFGGVEKMNQKHGKDEHKSKYSSDDNEWESWSNDDFSDEFMRSHSDMSDD